MSHESISSPKFQTGPDFVSFAIVLLTMRQ